MIFTDKNNCIKIYFGDKKDPFEPGRYFVQDKAFGALKKKVCAKSLTFLEQVHGINGYYTSMNEGLELLQREGDFLITNKPSCAIGILTADCLPIVIYDSNKKIVSVIHAGWRSSVAGITDKVIKLMKKRFCSNTKDFFVYFGPSAKKCCYEVDSNFYKNLHKYRIECFFTIFLSIFDIS